jgi:tRNA(Ile)-lysidine synthase
MDREDGGGGRGAAGDVRASGSGWPQVVTTLVDRCTFPAPGTEVACAVSGGADSLALLALGTAAGCRVTAIHVDHGLRPGSDQEAVVVEHAAGQVGARFRSVRVEVSSGGNLEARARRARRAVLPPGTATGHTMDDQAETVLLRMLRGAATDGLAGMRAGPEHPILGLRRLETQAVCRAMGWEPVVDPSNEDPRHLRNRVRHELLPLCGELARRDVVPILARQAGILAEESEFLQEASRAIDPRDVGALGAAPLVLARRALREWLGAQGGSAGVPPDARGVERVLAVVRGERRAAEVAPGIRIRRSGGRLRAEETSGPRRAEQGSGSVTRR